MPVRIRRTPKESEAVRIARHIRGMDSIDAEVYLMDSAGYSPAEAAEVVAACRFQDRSCKLSGYMVCHDWPAIYNTMRSTVECSVRLGDRLDDDLLGDLFNG